MSEVNFEVSEVTGLQYHGLVESEGEVSGSIINIHANMLGSGRTCSPFFSPILSPPKNGGRFYRECAGKNHKQVIRNRASLVIK